MENQKDPIDSMTAAQGEKDEPEMAMLWQAAGMTTMALDACANEA